MQPIISPWSHHMRRTLLVLALATPGLAGAQRDTSAGGRQNLPRDVQRQVESRWNTATGLRASSRVDVEDGREVRGDIAVQNGPLHIGGHVTGNVLAVNADVILRPSARIDGDLLVVGGEVEGRNAAYVGGEIRIYRQALRYIQRGDSIIADRSALQGEEEGWWRRLERRNTLSWSDPLRVAQAGPYNRVEGLPVSLGPSILGRRAWGSFRLDAAAVVRTGSSFGSRDRDVGYALNAEVRGGRRQGIGIGGRAYDIIDPVEDWQMSDLEVALSSFLFHRDYRDYYQRHGAGVYVTAFGRGSDVSFTASFSDERWGSRSLNDPFTIFHNGADWRPNPVLDEGRFHIGNGTFVFDTRTDPDDPWSGWFVRADLEGGSGRYVSVAPASEIRVAQPGSTVAYTRGFLDVRRYNRLSPEAQINLRVVLGGWLNGDELPIQRRLSIDGPGVLPGYDFRSGRPGVDVGTCGGGQPILGQPAQCQRIALAQIEYRGDFSINFDGLWDEGPQYSRRAGRATGAWVVFADAGRGWDIGDEDDGVRYSRGAFPSLSTFRSDIGVGVDFGGIGFYVAKAVTSPKEAANFFVRLRHRF
jgi:hypothetical protein